MSTQIELNVPESRKTTILCMWWLTADCPCLVFSVSIGQITLMTLSTATGCVDCMGHSVQIAPCLSNQIWASPVSPPMSLGRFMWVTGMSAGDCTWDNGTHYSWPVLRHVGWMPSNKWKLSVKTSVAAALVYTDVTLTWLLGLHVTAT